MKYQRTHNGGKPMTRDTIRVVEEALDERLCYHRTLVEVISRKPETYPRRNEQLVAAQAIVRSTELAILDFANHVDRANLRGD